MEHKSDPRAAHKGLALALPLGHVQNASNGLRTSRLSLPFTAGRLRPPHRIVMAPPTRDRAPFCGGARGSTDYPALAEEETTA